MANLKSISVTPPDPQIALDRTQPFFATAFYSDSSTSDVTAEAVWSSSDESVADIDAAGIAVGVGIGSCVISASYQGLNGNTNLTVDAPHFPLTAMTIRPVSPSLVAGGAQYFTAVGVYQDGSVADVTKQALWISSNPAAATIDTAGKATAKAVGQTNIRAVLDGITGETSVRITAPPPNTVPADPCGQLAAAKSALFLLSTGGAVAEVETPQLGRVAYHAGNIGDLQRLIDRLSAECAAAGGQPSTVRRRPISIEACP